MSILQWFETNSLLVIGVLFVLVVLLFNKLPSIGGWQAFLDSFESKGGQLMLLWVTDFIVLAVLVHYWKGFDAQLQTTIVGLLSGVNGAFLGAIGARPPAQAGNTNGSGAPPTNGISGGAVGPGPAADLPPAQPPRSAPAAANPAIGDVGVHGHVGDLGTNQPATAPLKS
jgi:hypothetical protein